jgi:hypothetical protein
MAMRAVVILPILICSTIAITAGFVDDAASGPAPLDRPIRYIERIGVNCDIPIASKQQPNDVAPILTDFLKNAPFNFQKVTKSGVVADASLGNMIFLSWDVPPVPDPISWNDLMPLGLQLSGDILIANSHDTFKKRDILIVRALFPADLASSGQPPKTLDPDKIVADLKTWLTNWPGAECWHLSGADKASAQKGTQYLSEVRLFASNYCPEGWERAAGHLLPISEKSQPLFKLLGTTYGGDGTQNFGLPDFSKQAPAGTGGNQRGPIWCIATSGLDLQKPADRN